jgi:NADH-quinone oxidoreductase subunit L
MTPSQTVQLILLLPLAGAIFCGVLGLFFPAIRRSERLIGLVGTGTITAAFVLAVMLFLGFEGEAIVSSFYTWMAAGDLRVDFAYRVDQLSLVMTLIITGIGALIHLYSTAYMKGDEGFWRFFAYLNLFIFAMLNLVLGDNLPVLFLGWEGVGLCSYLLIGFWYKDLRNSAAATKAFVVNRVGDFAFLVAMFILFKHLGALDFGTILGFAQETASGANAGPVPAWVPWVVGLLFIGATGKSAQIPLFVWLPDAMAGPTPVSALIHAATMVTSGLYLLARLSPLVLLAPGVMAAIGIVGALTAIMAATIAMTQHDIKKVLAYSTVSQLGFMFMAAGVGAFFVSIFHVMTHAFFKGCLFLGSGSVIHAMHDVEHRLYPRTHGHGGHDAHGHGHEAEAHDSAAEVDVHAAHTPAYPLPYEGAFDAQDMRTMGGLGRMMPATHITFLLATLAIAGIPLFSGFFSKDEILFRAFEHGYAGGHTTAWLVWGVGIVTALLTAIYMTRCYVLTFRGVPRWPQSGRLPAHESPAAMTIPLWVLAVLSVVGGFLGLPAVVVHLFGMEHSWIHHFLTNEGRGPVADALEQGAVTGAAADAHHVAPAIEWGLLALGALIAIGGVAFAWRAYSRDGLGFDAKVQRAWGGLYRLASQKWRWDEFYEATVRRPLVEGAAEGMADFDAAVVDGAVNGVAGAARGSSLRLRLMQNGLVQSYALAIVAGVVLVVLLVLLA